MASSCDPPSSKALQTKYDVFISFRGEDTRPTFTDHLYAALSRKNIDAYIDYQLKRGDEISAALLRAIEESSISLVIFSENYASSKWCLDELVKILECKKKYGQIVVPVFYEVDPSDVRHQKRAYAVAFDKHEHKFKDNKSRLEKWRNALRDAANLSGWHSSNFSREAELVEAIAGDLIQKLNAKFPYEHSKGLVGINQHIENVESLLDSKSTDVCIVGIWGMAGIGKTTIANAVFRKFTFQSEDSSCFLEDVRRNWKSRSDLRNKLLSNLLGEKNLQIDTPDLGLMYTRRLKRKKVFIILDNINDSEQLEYLTGRGDWFSPGSRIIVTTRDLQVLNNIDGILIYEVKGMEFHLALELFTFMVKYPPRNYVEFSKRAVSYCNGNPLALKVLGGSLCRKSDTEWNSALKKLRKTSLGKVQNVLRWSYEELENDEKKIFLDIACFFIGEDEGRTRTLLDGCGLSTEIGLRTLCDKCLMTISTDNKVLMHDLIQEMGLQIDQEERKHRRLWDPEAIYHVLKYIEGADVVEGIFLDMFKIKEVHLSPDIFNNMHNLRFLRFSASDVKRCNVHLSSGLNSLSDELRIFHWEQYPLKFLPSTYCPQQLIELNISHSCIVKLWDGVKNLENLKSVDLSFCKYLIELPDLSNALRLENIVLSGCTSLTHVSSSIFKLKELSTLNLSGCSRLKSLRSDICSCSLEWINLNGCSSLTEFSVISENIEYLNIGGSAIKELPSSIEHLTKLTELVLDSCACLQNLSDGFPKMGCLESLNLSGCPKLDKLFPTFDGLRSLRLLFLGNCLSLRRIPDSIGHSSSLNCLSLSGSNIETLPESIKALPQLKILMLKNCKKLWYLPQLPSSIQRLNATNCISLRIVLNSTSSAVHSHKSEQLNKRDLLSPYQGGYSQEFLFYNCIKLNKSALTNILADGLSRIQRAAYLSSTLEAFEADGSLLQFCLPGNQVPDWFCHQSNGSSLNIKSPGQSATDLKWLRFAFCLLLDASTCKNDSSPALSIVCKCHFGANCGENQRVEYFSEPSFTEPRICYSDHVFIWYDNLLNRDILYGMKDIYKENYNNHCPDLTFEFYGQIHGMDRVKMCGVLVLNEVFHRLYLPSRM